MMSPDFVTIVVADQSVGGRTLIAFDTPLARITVWLNLEEQKRLIDLLATNIVKEKALAKKTLCASGST